MTTEREPGDQAETLVLNALAAVAAGEDDVFADEASYDLIREAYLETTPPDRREEIVTAVRRTRSAADGTAEPDAEATRTLRRAVRDVLAELVESGVWTTIDHRVEIEVREREAALYTFACTRDPAALGRLALPPEVESIVSEGGALAADGEFEAAADAFERAIDRSAGESMVPTRVLAALANHWRGADVRAVDLVEEALHLETGAWSPTLAGLAADHRYPEKFRSGKLGIRVFLRHTSDLPEGGSIAAAVGFGEDPAWTTLPEAGDCAPLDRLEPTTRLRIELSGPLDGFPVLRGYYLGLGVVDLEVSEAREVDRILFSGPEGANATETIRFEPRD